MHPVRVTPEESPASPSMPRKRWRRVTNAVIEKSPTTLARRPSIATIALRGMEASHNSLQSNPAASAAIVDCNGSFSVRSISSLLTRTKQSRRRSTRHAASPPGAWAGAAKLERDVGDTVIAIAVSRDDRHFAVGATNKKAVVYSTSNGDIIATFTAKARAAC